MTVMHIWQIVGIAGGMLGIFSTVATWVLLSRQPTEKAITALDVKVDDHALRLLAVEGELKHLPSKDDLHSVKNSLMQVTGQLNVMQNEVASSARTLRRMEGHLLGERAA